MLDKSVSQMGSPAELAISRARGCPERSRRSARATRVWGALRLRSEQAPAVAGINKGHWEKSWWPFPFGEIPHSVRDFGRRLLLVRNAQSRLLNASSRSFASLRISAAGSRLGCVQPHARKAPQVKPRRADCTARESAWESRSLPA